MIKALTFTFIFISGVILFSNCEDENANPRSYPRVNTLAVTNISELGASFSADLYSLGTEKIIEHGFVWGTSEPTLTYNNRVYLGPCENAGTFQADVTTSLRKDIKYNVKPFIQTADHVVYGNPVAFKSLGSGAPVIKSFGPLSAIWMDTLIIKGKNFSWISGENVVKLNEVTCPTLTSTDTIIKVMVSSDVVALKSILSVDLAGNTTVHTKDTFRLIAPVIKDFFPKQARWGDTITVTGERFQTFGLGLYIAATLGGFPCNILERKSESFKFIVPLDIAAQSNLLNIKIHNQNYVMPEKVSLLSPEISGIRPKVGTWGSEVTLKGKFHPSALRNAIKIGGYTAAIVSNNKDSIKVKIPQNLSSARSVFLNNSAPFSIVSVDTFRLFGPIIESITPMSGATYSIVSIKGNYLQDPSGKSIVKFGSITAVILAHSQTQIDCKVPWGFINGPVKISVTVLSQATIFQTPYEIKNPIITSVFPVSGAPGDQITIEGENFLIGAEYPDVYFTSYSSKIIVTEYVSTSPNRIVVKVPSGLDSIPKKIQLIHRSYGPGANSSDTFILSPPQITSVSATVLIPGVDVTINGYKFDPVSTNNQVFWGKYPLKVISSTPNTIIATVPNNIPRGFNKISILSGGYRRTYTGLFESRSAWTEIPLPLTLKWSTFIYGGLGFSLNGLGYIIDNEGNMNSYNPTTKQFGDLGLHQEFKQVGFSKAIVNDTLFAVGYNAEVGWPKGLYRYDRGSNLWVYIATAPSNYSSGIAFSLNGKLYYGLTIIMDNYSVTRNLWVFDRVSKSWTPKNPTPYFSYYRAVAYFTIGNRGYVLYADRTFVEYNPDTDTWTKMASFPGPGVYTKGLAFFVLNNKGYIGVGRSDEYSPPPEFSDFWSFDPLNNSWTPACSMPYAGRCYPTWFVVNNKAYIGFGGKNSTQIRDFYEFDPGFISK